MGYDKLSYETDKDKVLQGFLDEIKKRDFESRLDREAIKLRDAEIERLKAALLQQHEGHMGAREDFHEERVLANTLRAQVEELTREVDMYNGITLGEVVKERDALKVRVNELDETLDTAKSDCIQWEKTVRALHQVKVEELQGFHARPPDPYAIFNSLQTELKLSQTCRDQAVDQLAECEKELDELRTEVERRGGYMDELATEVDRLREELRLERVDHYSTVKKLGNRAVNAEQVCDQLREKLAKAECDLDTVDQENIYLDAQREVLQKRLDDAYSAISHLSAKPVGPVQELPKQPTIELRPQLLSNKKMQEMLDQCAEQLKRDRERRW